MRTGDILPRSLAGWIPAGTSLRVSLHRIRSVLILVSPDSVADGIGGIRILNVSPLMRALIAQTPRWPLGHDLDATGDAFFTAFACLCAEWINDKAH